MLETTTYEYDENGNIITIETDDSNIRYQYDESNRLIREDNELLNKTITYKYDKAGNILLKKEYAYTSKETLKEETNKDEYIYDCEYRDRLISFNNNLIEYDSMGRPTKIGEDTYSYTKDGRYDYIETGSLLSIKKNVANILIPSEETRLEMVPMDYEEFRWALGDKATIPMLKTAFENKISLGDDVNRRMMRDFRLYMLVGGMPQAVNEYIETNNFSKVDQMKRSILELYQDDFRKIDSSGRASIMFSAIPSELAKNTSRYQISSVIPNEKQDRVLGIVTDMKDSLTVNLAYHANDPSAGMSLHEDITKYKMFISDTGLFTTLAFMDKDFTENIIYEKLLSDKLDTDLGYLYENMVAQMLYALGNKLFYYTFPKDNSTHNYEIDFLISKRNKICPIEVKSSGYKTHASIDEFIKNFLAKQEKDI